MLRADVAVTAVVGELVGYLQNETCPWREWDVSCGGDVAATDDLSDLGGECFVLDAQRGEGFTGDAAVEAERLDDVLGADVAVGEGACFPLCEDDDVAGVLGEAFEHGVLPGRWGCLDLICAESGTGLTLAMSGNVTVRLNRSEWS